MLNFGKSYRQSKEKVKKKSYENHIYQYSKSINLLFAQDALSSIFPFKEINNIDKKDHHDRFFRKDKIHHANQKSIDRLSQTRKHQHTPSRNDATSPSFAHKKFIDTISQPHKSNLSKQYVEIPISQMKELKSIYKNLCSEIHDIKSQLVFLKRELEKEPLSNSFIKALI